MASEDSVENLMLWDPPILAISIDGVGKLDHFDESFASPMPTLGHKVDRHREDLIIRYTRRKAHVISEERNDCVPQDLPIRDLQYEHALVPWFGKDRTRSELLRSHLQETSSVPVLIQKELRLNEQTERSRPMPL